MNFELFMVRGDTNQGGDLVNFLDDLDHFALYKNKDKSGFDAVISGLKANWFNGAGADGANWVIAVLRKEGTSIFDPAKTNFEIVENVLGNTRRYDAVVTDAVTINNRKFSRYFEFKSYNKVPPTEFAKQFLNDLNNPNIVDLSQLKWLFDAAKNPPDFTTNLKNAIDNMDFSTLTDATILKFGVPNRNALKAEIKSDFDSIFNLK